MTREEAIVRIKDHIIVHKMHEPRAAYISEALEMAIQALEKENIYDDGEHYVTISKALYDKLNIDYEKALSQKPCEDWYDVPSDEMTLEQARQTVKDLRKKLAEYLEQEPILDKIRAEIESMDFDFGDYYDNTNKIIEMVCKVINKYKVKSENK